MQKEWEKTAFGLIFLFFLDIELKRRESGLEVSNLHQTLLTISEHLINYFAIVCVILYDFEPWKNIYAAKNTFVTVSTIMDCL